MKILIGTTNLAKIGRFADLLQDYNAEFLTPYKLKLEEEPEETGKTPVENAVQKAKFYGQYCEHVICEDSGLFFKDLPLEDPRQPGLHIRSPFGRRLDDEEVIAHYARLVHQMGGKQLAGYVDGIAVYDHGAVRTFLDDRENEGFYLVDAVHPKRHPGWPLDSISVDRETGLYFVDEAPVQENINDLVIQSSGYRQRLIAFLVEALGLEKKEENL